MSISLLVLMTNFALLQHIQQTVQARYPTQGRCTIYACLVSFYLPSYLPIMGRQELYHNDQFIFDRVHAWNLHIKTKTIYDLTGWQLEIECPSIIVTPAEQDVMLPEGRIRYIVENEIPESVRRLIDPDLITLIDQTL